MKPDSQNSSQIVLAMETSGDVCSVAVTKGGIFSAEYRFRHEMHLSERIMSHVDSVLLQAETSLDAVDLYVVGIGPGSFTGTRIGVMTMKTFAALAKKPLLGINTLEAMAAEYIGADSLVLPMLPCRKSVVYTAPYYPSAPIPTPTQPPEAIDLDVLRLLIEANQTKPVLLCGPAATLYETEFLQNWTGIQYAFGRVAFASASVMAEMATYLYQNGERETDPLKTVPLYISPPPISMPKQPFPQAVF